MDNPQLYCEFMEEIGNLLSKEQVTSLSDIKRTERLVHKCFHTRGQCSPSTNKMEWGRSYWKALKYIENTNIKLES